MKIWVLGQRDKPKVLQGLRSVEPPYSVEIKKGGTRSLEQNAYLWGVVYETILDHELREQGWTNSDIHEYFLGECFGWEELDGLGRRRMKPLKRSSRLSKTDFIDYVSFVQQRCAETMGIAIPDPE